MNRQIPLLAVIIGMALAPVVTPAQGPFSAGMDGPTILSDTHGYDFGPYLKEVLNRVRVNWYTLIPEEAREGKEGRVVVVFNIDRDGKVGELRVVMGSGVESFDRASRAAVSGSNPFSKLPPGFSGDLLTLQLVLLYNNKK